ncbi:hypothetical protein NKH72_28305 [Mesorhizobium sp. M0955]|uniref:hypothetical protein n=1 Tax=Mesorhizobium sp. M0955 TaxID=2957033 RepID=UPI00333AB416
MIHTMSILLKRDAAHAISFGHSDVQANDISLVVASDLPVYRALARKCLAIGGSTLMR